MVLMLKQTIFYPRVDLDTKNYIADCKLIYFLCYLIELFFSAFITLATQLFCLSVI